MCSDFFIIWFFMFLISKREWYKDIKSLKTATWKYHLGRVETWTEEFCDKVGNNTVGRHALLTIPDHGLPFCSCQSYLYMVTIEITNLTCNCHRFSLDFQRFTPHNQKYIGISMLSGQSSICVMLINHF